MTATLILSDSMAGTAADDIAAANAGVDAVVEGNIIAEDDGGPGEMVEIFARDPCREHGRPAREC